jgi:hypothetical protein
MSSEAMARKLCDRIELLQGTLDMLILRTLIFGPDARTSDRQTHSTNH